MHTRPTPRCPAHASLPESTVTDSRPGNNRVIGCGYRVTRQGDRKRTPGHQGERYRVAVPVWLMIISLCGPPFGSVEWMPILDTWKANSARGRHKGAWTADNSELAAELQEAFDNVTAD